MLLAELKHHNKMTLLFRFCSPFLNLVSLTVKMGLIILPTHVVVVMKGFVKEGVPELNCEGWLGGR